VIADIVIVGAIVGAITMYVRYRMFKNRSSIKAGREKAIFITILAFLIAPLVTAIAVGAWSMPYYSGDKLSGAILGFVVFTAIGYEFALLASLVLGLPVFLLLKWLGLIRWWTSGIVGLLIGLVAGVAINWGPYHDLNFAGWVKAFFQNLVFLGLLGFISAFIFWAIWRLGQKSLLDARPLTSK
jgi:hypothetical protein